MESTFQIKLLSSLEKVFPKSALSDYDCLHSLSLLRNERSSFQLAYHLCGELDMDAQLHISSPLAEYIQVSEVCLIPAENIAPSNADDYYLTKQAEVFPDLLRPLESASLTIKAGETYALWFELHSETELPAGCYDVQIKLVCADGAAAATTLQIRVIDAVLPQQTLLYTNWFHTDCLATYYGVEVFSDAYWRIVENYLACAHAFGMNMVLTPVFTPPLDTQIGGERPTVQLVDVHITDDNRYTFGFTHFDRWVDMCERCGIQRFEIAHFFTQWGALHAPKVIARTSKGLCRIFGWETDAFGPEYGAFLCSFAAAFIEHITMLGIRERCMLHVSDEPGAENLEAYKKAGAFVRDCFPGFEVIDALSDICYYEQGLVSTPIPANDRIEPFIGRVPELWTYYCCAQGGNYVSNRFFAMPSQRTRVLGYQLYKFNAVGFLHWAFNFWFAQFSIRAIDPFAESDAGGAFFSGDAYVVYPGENGQPLHSLRLHVFYDALQDMRALQLLESRIGRKATLALLEEETEAPITFDTYPHSGRWHLKTRERINAAIAGTLS